MISIIIVLYNSKLHINNCLNSIKQSCIKNQYEIIILNNNSNDHYLFDNKLLKKENIINLESNIGYSAAVNKGVSHSKGEIILTLNPDVILGNTTVDDLLDTLVSNDNIGIVGGKAFDKKSKFQLSSIRRFPHAYILLTRFMSYFNNKCTNMYNYFDIDNNKKQVVDSISGSCMMFKKSIFNQLGGFDERFFLYFEDTDFCIRTNNLNYNVVYVPSSYMHIKGGSLAHDNRAFVRFHFYLSMIKFIFKYYYEYKMFFIFLILLTIINIL